MPTRRQSRSPGATPRRRSASAVRVRADVRKIDEELARLKKEEQFAREKVSLFRHPVVTLRAFFAECAVLGLRLIKFFRRHVYLLLLLVFAISTFLIASRFPGRHQHFVEQTYDILWWVFLGFLSSFGLGTGLHTFLLYLGPHIAEVTLAAYTCGHTRFATFGPNALLCDTVVGQPSMLQVLWKVQRQAIAWGIGTAIGELPPYFVARAARLSGERTGDTDEVQELLSKEPATLRERITKQSLLLLQRLGFVGIMLFASIPNPLFDLAGLMSGHLLVPFATFFGATAIGKGLIKVHIQSLFVIFIFSEHHLERTIALVERLVPALRAPLDAFVAEQKAKFSSRDAAAASVPKESLFARLWALVLTVMIGYFVLSIVNSTARAYLINRTQARVRALEAERAKLVGTRVTRSRAAAM